jgi:hypothetical protein
MLVNAGLERVFLKHESSMWLHVLVDVLETCKGKSGIIVTAKQTKQWRVAS